MFTYCEENGTLHDSSDPSNDNTNVINALQEPFVVKQDPGRNSSQSPPQINHHCCYGCGDPLEDIFCHQCTCELCGKGTMLVMVTILHPKFCLSIRNRVTIKTLISRKIFRIFNNNIFVVKIMGILMKLTNEEEKQIEEEQAAKARYWKIPICYDDDDDEDYTIAITHKEPDNSLSMGDEHLDTVPATKSDEFIKSSVENLFPNPSESEGEYEYPHHFNAESDLIESMLNRDSLIISSSSKIDSLFDEFVGKLTLLKSIPPGIKETDCDPEEEICLIKRLLYDNSSPCPLENFISENFDTAFESFSPFTIPIEDSDSLMKEIDLSFTSDDPMPPGIEEDDYDFERDILILEEFLSNDSFSLPENESFHFDIPSSSCPPTKPPDGNSRILNVKVMGDISEHKVPKLLPHLGHKAFQPSAECPMRIYERNTPILDVLFLHLYPP
uniref:Reverse transcriptase domain-containing protein n=1 Tax=Tanacetum cinerariifolium TaxID=118510 RepID=A0A699IPT5_TANCI|nr:hypothetical protein [Tanacetum cinerariifolium]